MFRRDSHNRISKAAHIKRNTAGTYNELSLSVLDAAREDQDSTKPAKKNLPSGLGAVPLFTLFGRKKINATPEKDAQVLLPSESDSATQATSAQTSATTPLHSPYRNNWAGQGAGAAHLPYSNPAEEVNRRKKRRRTHSRLVFIAVVLVVLAGSFIGYEAWTQNQAVRSTRIAYLTSAIDTIAEADEVIVPMDDYINGDMTSETAEEAYELINQTAETEALLSDAEKALTKAQSSSNSSRDEEAVAVARTAVSARQDMLNYGMGILEAAATARAVTDTLEAAWAKVIQADSLAREAASVIEDTTTENVEESRALSEEALGLLKEARVQFNEQNQEYDPADLSDFLEYISLRITAMECAIASDDAILSYDKEEASTQNDAYNEADAKAAELAEDLPASPSEYIQSVYELSVAGDMTLYEEARSLAASADAFLRDYLG